MSSIVNKFLRQFDVWIQLTPACSVAPSQAVSTDMGQATELKQHADLKVVIFNIYTPLRQLTKYSAA
jgi:hypothetical protein